MINTVDENIKIIREAIENNKLVVFIGSGVSLNSNYPSWSGLIREFADTIGIHVEKELGTDDYLRIAQYYYNERGAKEYYDCIYKKFNTKTSYNIIHDKILSMNPAHIITTNYDDLIEQAIENSHLIYDVVCEDIDLPYTPNGHLLIKMHGDLKRRNIVLKEDDYLLYSQRFKLIETFVKALFVNHVVLFIGYSLQDMDLKLIMKWVKDILGDHFQRAYFMDADDIKKSVVEINYLKNIGVNIINKTMLTNEYKEMPIDELKSEKGKNIVRCINYIMNYENEMTDVIDYFYRKLLIFNDLNRLRFKDVIEAMGIRLNYSVRDKGILHVYLNEDSRSFEALVNEFITQDKLQSDNINYDSVSKSKFIKTIFLNANIYGIIFLNKDTVEDISYYFSPDLKSKELNIHSLLKANNYYEINLYCEQTYKLINDHKNNYYNELIRAYANYTMHKYVSAYEIIKKLAKKAYKDKEYIIYYICEFNKKQLVRFIEVPYGFGETVYTEHLKRIQQEAKEESKNLDLRQLYYLLPKKERLSVSCLNDVILNGSYFNDRKAKIAELIKKIEEESSKIFFGGPPNGIKELTREVHEFWEYTHNYFLMVDDYSDIKHYYYNYISALFSTYSKKKEDIYKKENTLFPIEYSYVVPDYIFDELDLFIVYRYIKYDNLIKLINEYNIEKIKTNEPIIFYSALLNNIIHSYINLEFTNHLINILCNMLVVGTKLSLTLEETKIILTYVSTLLKEGNITSEIYKAVNYFVVQIYKSGLEISELVYSIINIFTLKILDTNKNTKTGCEMDKIAQLPYIKNLVFILRELHISDFLMDDNLIDKVIFNLLHGDLLDKKYDIIQGFIIPIYPLISLKKKEEIEILITNELVKSFNVILYAEACLNEIIKPNENFEETIYKRVNGFIENHNGEIISPDPIETHLRYVATLIYNKKIINKDKFADFVGFDNLFDFIFEPNNYQNYNDFELDWLKKFDNDYLTYISQIEKSKIGIGSKLKEEIMKRDIDKELKRIYFMFFDKLMA